MDRRRLEGRGLSPEEIVEELFGQVAEGIAAARLEPGEYRGNLSHSVPHTFSEMTPEEVAECHGEITEALTVIEECFDLFNYASPDVARDIQGRVKHALEAIRYEQNQLKG